MKSFFSNFLKSFVPGMFLLLWAVHPVWGAVLIDRIVAVVNREIITQSDLDLAAQTTGISPLEGGQEMPDEGVPFHHKEILSLMIEEKLILQEAKRTGVRVSDSELDFALSDIARQNRLPDRSALKSAVSRENIAWDQYVDNLKNRLIALKLINREVESNMVLKNAEVRAYYRDHPEQFERSERIRLTQVLFHLPEGSTAEQTEDLRSKAREALAEANKGVPFGRLIQKYSDGSEKQKGGDLGFFSKGDLALEIDRVVGWVKEWGVFASISSRFRSGKGGLSLLSSKCVLKSKRLLSEKSGSSFGRNGLMPFGSGLLLK
ncbi:MAG: SurA N-terminal domain-containing protein [Nitrospiria bacterium]